jgi:hypothetical protein
VKYEKGEIIIITNLNNTPYNKRFVKERGVIIMIDNSEGYWVKLDTFVTTGTLYLREHNIRKLTKLDKALN